MDNCVIRRTDNEMYFIDKLTGGTYAKHSAGYQRERIF